MAEDEFLRSSLVTTFSIIIVVLSVNAEKLEAISVSIIGIAVLQSIVQKNIRNINQ